MIWENTLSGMVDSTASRFDESTQYKKSDYVWYAATGVKPKLYKAKEDMAAGAWDGSKWEEFVVTKEFTNKDSIKTKNKKINGDIEFNGNDLIIKRGKCYKIYTTDINKTYHSGDFVCGYQAPVASEDETMPAYIKSGFINGDESDEWTYADALWGCGGTILDVNDDGEVIISPYGDASQIPEGFLARC